MSQSTCLPDNKPHHHYQLPSVKAPFSFLSAFKFAETRDKVSLCLTLILITVSATCFPVLSWIFGSFMQLLADWQNLSEHQTTFIILLFILTLTAIVVPITFMASRSLMYSIARRQVSRFRQKALESMLNYVIHGGLNYSEKSHHANYVQQLEQDCSFLLDTIGSKFPTLLWILGSITLSILVALFRGFQLALISLFIFPVFYIAFKAYQAIISDSQPKFSKLYEKPDLVVREVLKNIKAIVGLGGEYHELEKYEKSLLELERKIEPSFLYQGFALGGSSFLFYIGFALSLYVGNLFIQHGVIDIGSGVIYTLSDIICVTMCLYICVPIMYFAAPCLNAISKTEGVLVRLFSIIDTNYIPIERRSSSAAKGLPNTTLTLKEYCQLDQNLIVHRKGSQQQEEEEVEPLNACPMSPIWIQKPLDAGKAFNFEAAAKGDNITSVSNISVAGVSEDTLMRNSTYHPQTRIMLNSVTLMSQKTEGRCLLDNVTLEIMGKRATAIVVREQEPQVWIRSFFKLIQGIRRPDKGSVTVNESDLQCVGQDWGRENIFEIPDEPIIFPMTMRENLTLNRIHMSNEEIWRKIDAVDCDGLFSVVKKNLNKQIGFTENQLTQQDKRLIGILRAYFADPSIFLVNGKVFEGPNSQKIGRVLHKITKNKTLIIACPSMESVKGVETVLVAENGKIEELNNPEKGNGTLNIEELNQCGSNIGSPKSLSLSNSRRSSIIPYLEIKVDGGKDDEEDPFIEKIDTEDLDELNEVLGSYEESLVMNNDNELDEYYERLWQLVQAEASTFLFALLPTLANSVLVPLVITLIAKMLELIVSSISTTAPRRLRRSLAEVILVTFIIFGCYLVGISRLMWFKLKASNILRKEIFAKVLRMHVSWHAEPENSPEIISKRLNEDVNKASNAISLNQSLTAQIILNIVAAVVMTIFTDSQLGLISLSILLVLALVSTFIDIFEKKYQAMHKSKVAFATQFMSDAFDDIATLQRLPRKQEFLHYAQSLTAPTSYYYRKITLCKEIFVSFACFAMFVNTAIILVVGLPLYSNDEIKMESFIVCLIVPLFTIFELFKFLFLIVDSNTTTEASTNIFTYFDTKSLIDIEDRALLYKGRVNGDIEFRNVAFTYPGQKTPVLRGLSFKVSVNNKPVVILGGSKSGKEAISLLLLRMYEPDSGDILIDGINIKNYNLHYLRRKIGVIFENPCLFPGTVEYNVKYAEEYVQTIEAHDLTRSSAGSARSKAESVNKSAEALELGEVHKLAREMTEDLYTMQNVNEETISAVQKYRITVARTILRRPCTFVFELPRNDEGIKIDEMLKKVPSNATKLFIVDAEKIEEGDYDVHVLDEGQIGGERRKEIVKGKQEYLLLDI